VEIPFYGKYGPILGRLRFMVSIGAIIDLIAVAPVESGEHVAPVIIILAHSSGLHLRLKNMVTTSSLVHFGA
jgi:hypothetical protein